MDLIIQNQNAGLSLILGLWLCLCLGLGIFVCEGLGLRLGISIILGTGLPNWMPLRLRLIAFKGAVMQIFINYYEIKENTVNIENIASSLNFQPTSVHLIK